MTPGERRIRHAIFALVGAAAGARWHSQVDPEVFIVPQQQTVTPATAAPPTVASVAP